MTERPLLALVGPTASGKTEASIEIARALDAEIVCLDSMLVYRGMDIGTAKPDPEQRRLVPHHLLDLADPIEPFSVARFQTLARVAVADIESRGRNVLLVGGGGLYYRALVDGLEFPSTAPEVRALLEAEVTALGPEAMYRRLADLDPDAAGRIEPTNARRTVRALEVAALTGRPFSDYHRAWERYPAGGLLVAGVEVDRTSLYRRIELRVRGMMPGLLGEAKTLMEDGFASFLTSSQAIGYAEAVACLRGAMSEEEAAAGTIKRTKALARRQMAWLRRDPRIRWFAAGQEGAGGFAGQMAEYLGGRDRPVDAAVATGVVPAEG
jgi:tRNA dimethylallyltransferase